MPKDSDSRGYYNTLSMTFELSQPDEVLYVASSQPYTYYRLQVYLEGIEKVAKLNHSIYFRKECLALTLSSNSARC